METQQIISLLTAYKYFFLFPIVVVEGPIITIIAGFLSSLGILNIFIAFAVVTIADVTGDSLYYALGYYGREKFVERWGTFWGMTVERVKKLEAHFLKHTGKTLIAGKLTHAIGAIILVAAGVARIPFRKFIWFNLVATLLKSSVLLLIGYYVGESYFKIITYLDYTAIGSLIVAALFIFIYFLMRKISKKYENEDRNVGQSP